VGAKVAPNLESAPILGLALDTLGIRKTQRCSHSFTPIAMSVAIIMPTRYRRGEEREQVYPGIVSRASGMRTGDQFGSISRRESEAEYTQATRS